MNREIKFRGLTKDGKWVYGYYCKIGDCLHYIIPKTAFLMLYDDYPKKKHIHGFVEVIPETVGQFTGLLDKNGKEIWEGDIITIKDKRQIRKIVYCPNEGAFVASDIKWQAYIGLAGITDNYDCEIIGNIHSDPALLEKANGDS